MKFLRFEIALLLRARYKRHPGLRLREGEVGQNVFLLPFGEVPENCDPVGEHEHLGEVECPRSDRIDWRIRTLRIIGVVRVLTLVCVWMRSRMRSVGDFTVGVTTRVIGLMRGLDFVTADAKLLFIAKVALVIVSLLAALNLFVEYRLSAG